ncbi:GntR family transcriptional regulator [Ahrensia kielensis]|uniref:GntR family transcriptional regulator n=1 Tax=Ahrensia kielensis TaxID=76980 RepID=A0ABU9TAK3_9HYPH
MQKSTTKNVHSAMIAEKLEAEIVGGILTPGTKLDEKSLTQRFNVSRTPIREALQIICSRSLAERQPFRGVVVKDVSIEHIQAMFEAMAEMEAVCAGFAVDRITEKELAELEEQHRIMEFLITQESFDEYADANTAFHSKIYDAAHNDEIKTVAHDIRLKLAPFRKSQLGSRSRLLHYNKEHAMIIDLLKCGNKAGAQEAMRLHLNGALKAMLAIRQ